jgi:hypothetical protein
VDTFVIPIFLEDVPLERSNTMDALISTDRCDSCGSQAYVRFTKGEQELDFCGHHTNKYGDALDKAGWGIKVDTRELLTRRAVGVEAS